MAFVIPGIVGLVVWLPLWLALYRDPQTTNMGPEDAAALRSRQEDGLRRPWRTLLKDRKVWALVLGRVAADPVWYLYLFWLPDYLQRVRHLSLLEIGLYAWIPFLFADLGAVFGGLISDRLIKRGWRAPRARVAVLCGIAAVAPLGAAVGFIESTAVAMGVICVVAFLCQAWSTNMATLVPDLTAPGETASVMGLLGTAGSVGGIVFAQVLGFSIGLFGYSSAFVLAAILHPLSLVVLLAMLRPVLRSTATASPEPP